MAKRGEGRFSEAYVSFIMDSFVTEPCRLLICVFKREARGLGISHQGPSGLRACGLLRHLVDSGDQDVPRKARVMDALAAVVPE